MPVGARFLTMHCFVLYETALSAAKCVLLQGTTRAAWGGSLCATDAPSFAAEAARLYNTKDLWDTCQQQGYTLLQRLYDADANLAVVKVSLLCGEPHNGLQSLLLLQGHKCCALLAGSRFCQAGAERLVASPGLHRPDALESAVESHRVFQQMDRAKREQALHLICLLHWADQKEHISQEWK